MAVEVCQACRVHLPHTWNGFIQSTPAVIGTFQEAGRVNYPNDKNYANSSTSSSFCLFSPSRLYADLSSSVLGNAKSEACLARSGSLNVRTSCSVFIWSWKCSQGTQTERPRVAHYREISRFVSLTRSSRAHGVRGDRISECVSAAAWMQIKWTQCGGRGR